MSTSRAFTWPLGVAGVALLCCVGCSHEDNKDKDRMPSSADGRAAHQKVIDRMKGERENPEGGNNAASNASSTKP